MLRRDKAGVFAACLPRAIATDSRTPPAAPATPFPASPATAARDNRREPGPFG